MWKLVLTGLIATTMLLSGCQLASSNKARSPVWSPDGTKIIFNRTDDIYVMNSDGSNQTRLTNNPYLSFRSRAWSPNGTKIAYVIRQAFSESHIYIMNEDGSNQTNLINSHRSIRIDQLAWSPDGTKIAYTCVMDDIYVINADGTNQTNITNSRSLSLNASLAWSPDGTKIAFDFDDDIYVINADGTNQTNITASPQQDDSYPVWSPDGTKIAFVSLYSQKRDIYVINVDGSNQTRLTNNPSRSHNYYPAWSPDGKKIAFTRYGWGLNDWAPGRSIYIMNADGSNQTRLTNDVSASGRLSWSPDGTKIAFSANTHPSKFRGGYSNVQVFIMAIDGSSRTRLTGYPDWVLFFVLGLVAVEIIFAAWWLLRRYPRT